MANPEHLEVLKQGLEVWNEWVWSQRDSRLYTNPIRHEGATFGTPGFWVDLRGADLSGLDLYQGKTGAGFEGIDLIGADLRGANLDGANLAWARLLGATLFGASVRGANIASAIFHGATLAGADLSRSLLTHTDFLKANLRGADLTEAVLSETTFSDTDLSEARGLEHCIHIGPSTIDHRTLAKSGRLPLSFLRGGGLPDTFITYIPSLLNDPIQFYTCFISFTEADDAFSERLYNDLQAKGVRCWRWKEDAKWGRTLMRSIDEAVHVYDKLIVICSEQSLNSPAVIREIERALQKEDDLAWQGKEAEVLFPIRLDDYIFTGWQHHRKADVTAKNVGDFRHWKDHDSYQKAFDRLLRDLKAEGKKT